jgi:hypothetical protein
MALQSRFTAMGIAARTAMKLGKTDEAGALISQIPTSRIRGGLAHLAIQLKITGGDKGAAFELAKAVLSREMSPNLVEQVVELSHELGRLPEVVEALRANPQLEEFISHNPQLRWQLERVGLDLPEFRERSAFSRHRRLQR